MKKQYFIKPFFTQNQHNGQDRWLYKISVILVLLLIGNSNVILAQHCGGAATTLVKWDFDSENIQCNGSQNMGPSPITNPSITPGATYCPNINNSCGKAVLGSVGHQNTPQYQNAICLANFYAVERILASGNGAFFDPDATTFDPEGKANLSVWYDIPKNTEGCLSSFSLQVLQRQFNGTTLNFETQGVAIKRNGVIVYNTSIPITTANVNATSMEFTFAGDEFCSDGSEQVEFEIIFGLVHRLNGPALPGQPGQTGYDNICLNGYCKINSFGGILPATCSGTGPNDDAQVLIQNFEIGNTYDFNEGDTYDGTATYASGSTAIPADGLIPNFANPVSSTNYTFRVFQENCFSDFTVTLDPKYCCIVPDGSVVVTAATCDGDMANDDAQITVTGVTGGTKVGISTGGTYSGPGFSTAQDLTGGEFTFTDLPNPLVLQEYTIRVFDDAACYIDYNASVFNQNCFVPCTPPNGVTLESTMATCAGDTRNSDATIEVSNVNGGDRVGMSPSITYAGPDYDSASDLVNGGFTFSGISTPDGAQIYTIRIYNTSNGCYLDQTVEIDDPQCGDCVNLGAFVTETGPNMSEGEGTNNQANFESCEEAGEIDLALTKTVSPSTGLTCAETGTSFVWTLMITNSGDITATDVNVVDLIPDGLSVSAVNPSQGDFYGGSGWDVGDLAANASATLEITTTATIAGDYTNCAYVNNALPDSDADSSPDNTEAAEEDDDDCAMITVTGNNPPVVQKAISPRFVLPNEPVLLTFKITNNNSVPITMTSDLVDAFPSSPGQMVIATDPKLYISDGITLGGAGITAAAGGTSLTIPAGTVLEPGLNQISVEITVPVLGNYCNIIEVGDFKTDLGENCEATETCIKANPVFEVAPVVTKRMVPESIAAGETSNLVISIENKNSSTLTLIQDFIDPFPSGLVVAGAISSTCNTATLENGDTEVKLASGAVIAANSACVITIPLTAAADGTYCNVINMNQVVTGSDPNTINGNEEVAEACLKVEPQTTFDLALIKTINTTATPGPYAPGSNVQFTITVTNQGTIDAYDIDVADYYNASELSVPTLVAQAAVTDNGGGTYTIDQVDAGASVSFDVLTTIDASFAGTSIFNNAEITGGSETDGGPDAVDEDSTPNNNSTSDPETDNDDVITDNDTGGDIDDDAFEDDYDVAIVTVTSLDECSLEIAATAQSCDVANNLYDLVIDLTYANEPAGDITIMINGNPSTYTPDGTSPDTYTVTGISSDGVTGISVSASFVAESDCNASTTYDAPVMCFEPMVSGPCTSGEMGGSVFVDADANGQDDDGAATTDLSGIQVQIFGCDASGASVLIETVLTDASGNYSFSDPSIVNGGDYRIEFSNLPSGLQLSLQGANNDGETVFTTTVNCDIDLGLLDPSLLCEDNPIMMTNCYVNGTMDGGVLVSWNYNDAGLISGGRPAPTYQANNNQIGTTWGLAYHRTSETAFTSAFLKRHSRLIDADSDGSGDLGAIYSISMDGNPANDNSPLWLDIDGAMDVNGNTINVGSIPNDSGRGIVGTGPNNDAEAYTKVGKVGIGDIDLNSAHDELWAVNVFDKTLLAITINSDMTPGPIRSFDIPTNQCNGTGASNDSRPFAVKYFGGSVYVGVVCSGENTNSLGTMSAYVYRLDDDGTSTTFTEVLSFDLDYNRDSPDDNAGCNSFNNWLPWSDTWPGACCCGGRTVYPQPLLSDIEFNITTGEMLLGFIDRFGHQSGFNNYAPTGTAEFGSVSGGEVLKSTHDGDGTYTIETNISSTGPTGDEFYTDDFFDTGNGSGHDEIGLGGLAIIPGASILVSTAYDPINGQGNQGVFISGGTIKFDNATGAKLNNQGYQIFNGNDAGTFGKAAGLGDLELLCSESIIQIGNYAWIDTNGDGVQDPCEDPLPGLTVKLYTKPASGNAQLVATTTTSATGEYYFTDNTTAGETWAAGFTEMEAGDYFIAFCGDSYDPATGLLTVGAEQLLMTTANTGMGSNFDLNDSDVAQVNVPGVGDMPAICISVTETDFTFDAGFVNKPIIELVDIDITCGPASDGGALFLTVEGGMEPFTYDWSEDAYDGMTTILNVPVGTYTVTVTDGTGCSETISAEITVEPCAPNPCTGDNLGGTVFNDINIDGVNDGAAGGEEGPEGILVQIFECDATGMSVLIDATYTDSNGDYFFTNSSIIDGNDYRIEFSGIPDGYTSSLEGTDNGTSTQFVDMVSCDVDYGIFDPGAYCEEDPTIAVACYIAGDPLNNAAAGATDAIVSINHNYVQVGTGGNQWNDIVHNAVSSQVGSVWGLGWNPKTQELLSSAFLKRHVGLGPNGIGAIYTTDYSVSPTTTALLVDLSSCGGIDLGTISSNSARGLGAPGTGSVDAEAYGKVGKIGYGDIDYSDDYNTLYMTNLNERNIVILDMTNYNATGTAPTCSDASELAVPYPSCTNGVARIFGLKYYQDKLYVTVTCTGENGGATADLNFTILSYDFSSTTWNTELTGPLNYTKGAASAGNCTTYRGWIDNVNFTPPTHSGPQAMCYPTPLVSDIEFDSQDGSMIIGIMDRGSHQWGFNNLAPSGGSNIYDFRSAGDVLRAALNGSNNFVLESGGTTIDGGGCGGNGQGPGGGEYYCGERFHISHFETAMGSLAHLPGSGELLITAMDPKIGYANGWVYTGGFAWLNNMTGSGAPGAPSNGSPRGMNLYGGSVTGSFGKAGGLGDVEILCGPAPIQLGNYVWLDANGDGVQDPCESPLPGLTVKLYTKPATGNAVLAATTTTDADGEYYFTNNTTAGETWETGFTEVEQGEDYYIVFCGDNAGDGTQFIESGGEAYVLTSQDTGMGDNPDLNDSDGSMINVPGVGNSPTICVTADSTNHTLDIGLKLECGITITQFSHLENGGVYQGILDVTWVNGPTTGELEYRFDDTGAWTVLPRTSQLASDSEQFIITLPLGVRLVDIRFEEDTGCFIDMLFPFGLDDPAGYFYCERTGEILEGGFVTVTPPSGGEWLYVSDENGDPLDGRNGFYEWLVVGSPVVVGHYIMETTAPVGNELSMTRVPGNPAYGDGDTFIDPTDGEPDNPMSLDSLFLGSYANADSTFLLDFTAAANPFFLDFLLHPDDAFIFNNNIPIKNCYCDLALVNKLDEVPTSISVGDTIKYDVIIENQGDVDATNIEVKYGIPNGFDYVASNDGSSPGWTEDADCATTMITDVIPGGESDTICIYLTVENVPTDEVTSESWTTVAEISSFEDPADPGEDKEDFDSTPDSDLTNDPGGNTDDETDDETGGDGSGDPDDETEDSDPNLDEDDNDPAIIYVCDAAAIVNTDDEGPFQYLDTVKYNVVVFNQGNGDITNVEVNDFLGAGLEFITTPLNTAEGWTGDSDQVTGMFTETIGIGESDTLCLELQLVSVLPYDTDAYVQTVEIEVFEDPANPGDPKEDIDSTPDDDPDNDSGGNTDDDTDDETDGGGEDPNDPDDTDPEQDEDDNDSDELEVFDLAITKKIVDDRPYAPGEVVMFEMTVYNQGNVDAASYELTDYMTDGFTFSTAGNPGWAQVGDDLEYTSTGTLMAGDSATVSLQLTIVIPAVVTGLSDWWNYVEISAVDNDTDTGNDPPMDADSTPDNDEENDNDVEPDDDDDNEVTENGNGGEDEDDHDPADVIVGYDIALAKTVSPAGPYSYGDTLTYDITLTNQGGLTMTNIAVYDSLPCGLLFLAGENPAWDLAGSIATTTYEPQLASGESTTLELKVVVQRCTAPGYTNYYNVAEVSDFDDEDGNEPTSDDIDSTPDDDPNNDGDPINDEITDPMDEDDHDYEDIEICDVALINTIAELDTPPSIGDTVKYEVIVENQGNHDVNSVTIDYDIPNGFTYLSVNGTLTPAWTSTSAEDADVVTVDAIAPGERDTVCLYLQLENVATDEVTEDSWTTIAEITEYTNGEDEVKTTDADSTPDDDPTNDPGGNPDDDTDDEVDGDGSGDPDDPNEDSDPELDEDDHDPTIIYICDVATIIYTEDEGPHVYGDTIKYVVEIHNQGNGDITNVLLQNQFGTGLEFLTAPENLTEGWVAAGSNFLEILVDETIAVGDTLELCLLMELVPDSTPTDSSWLQTIEVVQFEDPASPGDPKEDVDSTPDDDLTNDPGGNPDDMTDDETDGEGSGDPTDPNEDTDPELDEDDHDPVLVYVFDLALTKTTIKDTVYIPGESVLFHFNVYNQGNVAATTFTLTDYMPDGFSFATTGNPGWAVVGDNLEYVYTGGLASGANTTIDLTLTAIVPDNPNAMDWWNYAEISSSDDDNDSTNDDPIDADSTADNDPDNDNDVEPTDDDDDEYNEQGGPGEDEDDHDPERIIVGYDLALNKTVLENGPYSYGDTLTYRITVYNQGGLPVTNVAVVDYLPCGLQFVSALNTDWTMSNGVATTIIEDQLDPGTDTYVDIKLVVQRCAVPASDNYYNAAEISDFKDDNGDDPVIEDYDSTPDDDPENDDVVDEELGGPSDEDDHDPEDIVICDLALINYIAEAPESVKFGDEIKYEVVVFNQGNHTVNSATIAYLVPNGFEYLAVNDAATPAWNEVSDGLLELTTAEVLLPNESDTICLVLRVVNVATEEVTPDSWTTIAEITEYTNGEDEVKTTDADSVPNDDFEDDGGGNPDDETNDEPDGDGTGDPSDPDPETDEDDQDPEILYICDVATVIYTDHDEEASYYDEVKFTIEVHNQGNGPITNVLLQELFGEGWEFVSTDANVLVGWTEEGAGELSLLYDEIIDVGEVDTICLELKLVPDFDAEDDSWLNTIEVVSFEDPDSPGDPKEDIDSVPDDIIGNDSGGNPDDDTNDDVDGDGTGDPNDPNDDTDPELDEDDQDPEDYKVFDLALIIQLDSMPPVLPVVPDDILKFIVVTTNQGNVTANNVLLSNYVMPENLELASMSAGLGWTVIDDSTSQITLDEPLLPGEVDTTCIYLTVINGGMADMITWAEISGSDETDGDCIDIDSTPNDDNTDDIGGTPESDEDDHIEDDGGDGNDDGITDEDDHDPAQLHVQDLALIVWTDHKEPVKVGQDINFIVRVVNQGNIDNEKVKVVTYLPEGFCLSNNDTNGWVEEFSDLISLSLPANLDAGTETEVNMLLKVKPGAKAETLIIFSEIASSTDPEGNSLDDRDVDSTPDENRSNDVGGEPQDPIDCNTEPTIIVNDNLLTGAGRNGEDEDDHDPAWVQVYDLATIIYTYHTQPIIPGDDVKFDLELHNQGNMAAEDIELTLYMPNGFELSAADDNGWTVEGGNLLKLVYGDALEPVSMDSLCLTLTVQPDNALESLIPYVEISMAMDTLGNELSQCDVDSNSDTDPTNDIGGFPDSEDDNNLQGLATMGEDEDDHDPVVPPVLDLAIRIVNTEDGPSVPGDLVKFLVTVYNQGSITPKEFDIENYVPSGLTFEPVIENAGWTAKGNNATYNYQDALEPFQSDTLCIFLRVNNTAAPLTVVDMVEIISVTDEFGNDVSARDIDSVAEDSNENDKGNDLYSEEDNKIHENGRSGDDEDDHDQAHVLLCREMTCIHQINISLDSDCEVVLTPQMLMKGDLFPDEYYEFSIADGFGNYEPIITLTMEHLGMQQIKVLNPICANACWSNVLVEYKNLPQIDCPVDMTVSCGALDVLPMPTATIGNACVAQTLEVYLASERREKINCGDASASQFTHRVERAYEAKDNLGNVARCSHTIMIERIDLSGLEFPPNATINCSDLGNYMLNEDGIPLPWLTTGIAGDNLAGVPVICQADQVPNMVDAVCPSTGAGTAIPLIPHTGASLYNVEGIELVEGSVVSTCSAFVQYTDVVLPKIGCTQKVMRTWNIVEWYCSSEIPSGLHTQVIELVDDTAPVIECPAAFSITTGNDCGANIELPAAITSDACDNGINVTIEHPWGIVTGNGGQASLDAGVHTLTYKVADDCYNQASCATTVTVVDNTQPIAICDQFTVISISQAGNTVVSSEVFDDGSWDECGEVTSCVVRMSDLTKFRSTAVDTVYQGVNYIERTRMNNGCLHEYAEGITLDGIDFISEDDLCTPYIRFCCEDVGDEHMVVFRAMDQGGNSGDCMVTVEIQDKAIPNLSCPADMTIDCRVPYDLDNLSLTYGGSTIDDNCASTQVANETVDADINQCGIGSILRTFSLTNDDGLVLASCKQEITVGNDTPFAGNIEWPLDFEVSCGTTQVIPETLDEIYAYPRFIIGDDNCSLLGYDYRDQYFAQHPTTGECGVIKRSWTVIDWCNEVNGEFVTYPATGAYMQTIKVTNADAPVIAAQDDLLFSSSDIDCESGDIAVTRVASDDCTPVDGLAWSYTLLDGAGTEVSVDADGATLSGFGSSFSGSFVADTYTVIWNVCDGCGNCSATTQVLELVNTKAPTPICKNGISISLGSSGDAELWASDIDGGSYHSCDNPFTLSFDANIAEQLMLLTCDDEGVQQVSLYVKDDLTGIQDFCVATVDVQDPLIVCAGQRAAVAGYVYTEDYKYIEDVEVQMATTMPTEMTNVEGYYAFGSMPMGGDYMVAPEKDDAYLNGVSTLDLILMQRHILGIAALDSPYKLIAADINSSKEINGVDLVELRKLILGIYTELPANDSWRFIDAGYEFVSAQNPWLEAIAEDYEIENLSTDMDIDFIGVKIGDVNGSVVTDSELGEFGARNSRWPLVLEFEEVTLEEDELTTIPVYGRNYESVSGWQTSVEFDSEKLEIVEIIGGVLELTTENYNYDSQEEGWMTLSYGNTEVEAYDKEEVLFQLVVRAKERTTSAEQFVLSSKITKAEAYRGYEVVVDMKMDVRIDESVEITSVNPNPWITNTEIEFMIPEQGKGIWEFFDVNGKTIHRITDIYESGKQVLRLNRKDLDGAGVIYIKLTTDHGVAEYKMISVR